VTQKPPSRYVAEKADLKCIRCGNDMRRLARQGFLERNIYSYFGYYPWECPMCRERVFFKSKHGHKRGNIPETTIC
jgi:DNA-directed RNA polymerase subunit RPC12/RpoP